MHAIARRLPFHYAWLVLGWAIFGNMIAAGTMFWSATIYVPRVADEFDVGRSVIVGAIMGGQTLYAFVQPFVGRYIDRRGARRVMQVGVVLSAIALIVTSQATGVWQFYVGWFVVSFIRPAVMPIPYNWTLTRWFEGRRRQAALGLVTVGFGLGGAVMLPVFSLIADAWDWRAVMATSGVLLLLVQGAMAFVIVRDRPAELGLEPVRATRGVPETILSEADEWGFTGGEAMRTPAFWMMSVGLMLFFLGQGSVTTLSVDFFDSRAIAWGAFAVALSATVRTVARIPLGFAMGGIRSVDLLGVGVNVSQAAALVVLLAIGGDLGTVLWVMLWGLGGSFAPMLEPLMINHGFGVRHFGAVSGMTQMVAFGGQLIGSVGGAFLYDVTGSYTIPFALYALGFTFSAVLFFFFGRLTASDAHAVRAEMPPPHLRPRPAEPDEDEPAAAGA